MRKESLYSNPSRSYKHLSLVLLVLLVPFFPLVPISNRIAIPLGWRVVKNAVVPIFPTKDAHPLVVPHS